YDDTKIKDDTGKPIKRKAAEIVINTMQMLDRAQRRDTEGGDQFSGSAPAGRADDGALDEEIPF
ncbi:MAG: hypothetical protein ABI182_07650, partial [Candidatus Baltobacteraceae bacterium]